MLTIYHTDKELVNELNLVTNKFYQMLDSWLREKLQRQMKKNKNGSYLREINIKGQKYEVQIFWNNNDMYFNILTFIETDNGKCRIDFGNEKAKIFYSTPHFNKRAKERYGKSLTLFTENNYTKYKRNNRDYILIKTTEDNFIVARISKIEPRIVYLITYLTREMCNNNEELLSKIGKSIDENDIYEWV